MALVSVIVPVYKVEKYLERCVESIRNQTLEDIEIILVDDGSPDKCPQMCDEYERKDSRIRVIHKENAGVAAARNSGLNIATGQYVAFVDSDDYIEPNMYQAMLEVAINFDCDLVMCDCKKEYLEHEEVYTHDIRSGFYSEEQLRTEYYPHLIMMENVEYPATISNWLFLYRRTQQSISELRYLEGVRFSEDLLFGVKLIYKANSFYYMKGKTYYHYCMNPQSATHKFAPDKWKDFLRIHSEVGRYFCDCLSYDFRYQIDLLLLFFVYNASRDIICTNQITEKEKLEIIGEILGADVVTGMFDRLCVLKLPVSAKQKILTYCFKYRVGIRLIIKRRRRTQ